MLFSFFKSSQEESINPNEEIAYFSATLTEIEMNISKMEEIMTQRAPTMDYMKSVADISYEVGWKLSNLNCQFITKDLDKVAIGIFTKQRMNELKQRINDMLCS